MRERACRLVPLGPILLIRIVEREYGEGAWRLVEEWDVTGDLHALLAKGENPPIAESPPAPAPDEAREPATLPRNGQ